MRWYLLQAFHNVLVHGLMGLLGRPPAWLLKLHDVTARWAWPELGKGLPPGDPERYDLMDAGKREALGRIGFKFGIAEDFLGLSEEELKVVEAKVGEKNSPRRPEKFDYGPPD